MPTARTRHRVLDALTRASKVQRLENLSDVFATCGPVLGVARPSDPAVQHRIHRLYVRDERWQEVVGKLVNQARLVFIHYSPTQALDWELEQALARPDVTVFVYITGVASDVAFDRDRAVRALPNALQQYSYDHVRRASAQLAADQYALLITIGAGVQRMFSMKHHFDDLWRAVFWEIVRRKLQADKRIAPTPPGYAKFIEAVAGNSSAWIEVGLFVAGAAIAVAASSWL